jgi:Sulfatase
MASADVRQHERRVALGLLAAFFAVMLTKALCLRVVVLGGVGNPMGVVGEIALIGACLVAADLFFPDLRFRAMLIANVVLSAVMLGIAMYVSYYGLLPTPQSLRMVLQATAVGSSITQLLRPLFLLFVIDLPIAVAWAYARRRRVGAPVLSPRGLTYVYQYRAVYASLVPVACLVALSITGVRHEPTPIDAFAASRQHGVLPYVASSLLPQPGRQSRFMDSRSVQQQVNALHSGAVGPRIADFAPGAASGKNVIVIQVEALQRMAVGAVVEGQPVTPALDSLIANSWYFPDCYSGVGHGTSSDAEFIASTSLYPSAEGAASLMYADKRLPSMPRMLAERGYESLTFHTNDVSFWNRSQLYPALGYTKYYDRRFFGNDDEVAFGASDEVLFSKTLAELVKKDRAGTKFYASIVTMSSHHPFTHVPASKRALRLGAPYAGTMVGDYLAEINYADRALGQFLDGLKREGLLDDSIVVVYGDHFAIKESDATGRQSEALSALLGRPYTAVDRMNVPLIVHLPGQTQGKVVEDTVGQVDIMPTVADALGLDLAGVVHFGRDAFVTSKPLLPAGGFMETGSYLNDHVLYTPGDSFEQGRATDLASRRPVAVDQASASEWQDTRALLQLCDDYVRSLPVRPDFDPKAPVVLPK